MALKPLEERCRRLDDRRTPGGAKTPARVPRRHRRVGISPRQVSLVLSRACDQRGDPLLGLGIKKGIVPFNERRSSPTSVWRVADAFLVAHAAIAIVVEKQRWIPEHKYPLDAWQKYKGVLALELPLKVWNEVEIGVMAVDHFGGFLSDVSSAHANDAAVEHAKPLLRHMQGGLDALKPYTLEIPTMLRSDRLWS